MNQKLLLTLCLAAFVFASASGCSFFRKSKKPKENPNIAAEVEAGFRDRWIERRVAELGAQGVDPQAAQAQAVAEFNHRYPYLRGDK